MTNQGQKALAGQVRKLRIDLNDEKYKNFSLNNEIRVLQSKQLEVLQPSFFKALRNWFKQWKSYRS